MAWVYRVSLSLRVHVSGIIAASAIYCIASFVGVGAWAGDTGSASGVSARPAQTYEIWSGADVSAPGWSVYGGLTAALFGDLRESGWRIRAAGGYGRYRYTRSYWDADAYKEIDLRFVGYRRSIDTLLGYQFTFGPTTLKAFAGVTQEQKLDSAAAGSPIAFDDENGFQGERFGLKLAVETWTRLGDWGFVQADASWSQPMDSYAAQFRLGYRMGAGWSTGLEMAAYGNTFPDQGRAGAFLRFEWERGEVSVSGGAAGDELRARDAYGTLNVLLRF